jgi:hypothetical protein
MWEANTEIDALVLANLSEHFCSTALGTLLLRNGIVGARESCKYALLAWMIACANALDLSSMTAVKCEISVMFGWGCE